MVIHTHTSEAHYKQRLITLKDILSKEQTLLYNHGWVGGIFKLIVESPVFDGVVTYKTQPHPLKGTTVYYCGYYEFSAIAEFFNISETTAIWLTHIEGLNVSQVLNKINCLLKLWDVRDTFDFNKSHDSNYNYLDKSNSKNTYVKNPTRTNK